MSFLEVAHVSKSYSGAIALNDARLDIAQGEVHALMGENGAGKSTIIKILAGVTAADSMAATIDGKPVTISDAQESFRHGLRFIHQELNIVPHLSVAENIMLGLPYPGRFGALVDWRKLNAMARAALDKLQVSHIDTRIKAARLSTGDQMLMKIAATLISAGDNMARLYVMDEPTAALTGAESRKLFEVIDELKQSGASILYVSHRMNEVMEICDRVTVFRDGQTIATRNLSDTDKNEVIHLMTGRDVKDSYPPHRAAKGEDVLLEAKALRTRQVRDVDFQVNRGEILGIAGLADAGQSAVLLALMGVDRMQAGHVTIHGSPIAAQNPSAAWRNHVAYIPRERRREGLMLQRRIVDNINLPHLQKLSFAAGFLSRRRERRFADALGKKVRLKSGGMNQACYQLSGGNQQKVVFARALGDAPELLLLDEPTRGVDVGAKFDIYTLIRERSAEGAAVVMTSSDLPELIGMCDRILIMREGAQHSIIETDGLSPADLLAKFYD
tara:strand:+ start:255200 stop:256699 length:1500 start_codon:yes stop_codon:yes gene_type:complete